MSDDRLLYNALQEIDRLRAENEKLRAENETHKEIAVRETMNVATLRAALNDIEAYVEGRVITHRDIAELAESSMSGKKQRVRMSEAADILGKIRAAAAALKETE